MAAKLPTCPGRCEPLHRARKNDPNGAIDRRIDVMRPTPIDPAPDQESVWDYPRPPAVAPDVRRVRIEFAGVTIADSISAIRVLETSHPPTFYLPLADVRADLLRPASGASVCEWKGAAASVDVAVGDRIAREAGWFYPSPSAPYSVLTDHVAFYAGRLDRCTVGDDVVVPQPGGFYGGWITPEVAGPFKGEPGTSGW
jgi:uncharacterized protein (DUF427 family)